MLWENVVKFKDPLPEKFSETYKHKIAYTTSGDSQTLEAHIQIPGGGMVLTLDVFYHVPSTRGTPPQTQLIMISNVGPFPYVLPGTPVTKFPAQEIPTQQHIIS